MSRSWACSRSVCRRIRIWAATCWLRISYTLSNSYNVSSSFRWICCCDSKNTSTWSTHKAFITFVVAIWCVSCKCVCFCKSIATNILGRCWRNCRSRKVNSFWICISQNCKCCWKTIKNHICKTVDNATNSKCISCVLW